MEQFEIPKVRLKFRQFLSYYAVNPDRWLLDPPFLYQSEAPNVFIVRLDLEFVQALDSVTLCRDEYSVTLCRDESDRIQYRFRKEADDSFRIQVKVKNSWPGGTTWYYAMSLVDRDEHPRCGWEITFSWFGRMQYRLWRRRRKKSSEREKELQMYRDFLESVQSDVDEQFQKAKTYIDKARDDMKQAFKNK